MTYTTEAPVKIIPADFYLYLQRSMPNTSLPDNPNPQEAAYRLGVQRVLETIRPFVKWEQQ